VRTGEAVLASDRHVAMAIPSVSWHVRMPAAVCSRLGTVGSSGLQICACQLHLANERATRESIEGFSWNLVQGSCTNIVGYVPLTQDYSNGCYTWKQRLPVRVPVEVRFFSSSSFRPAPGPHPDSSPVDTWGLSSEVKLPRRQSDYTPPTTADLYIHSPIRLHGIVLS
jgi:hypothetical protein